MSDDRFQLEADCLFLKIIRTVHYIGNAQLKGQNWQICFYYCRLLRFHYIRLENNSFELFCQGLIWHFYTLVEFFLNSLLFCSLSWSLDCLKIRKKPNPFHTSAIFNFKGLRKTTSLNSNDIVFVETISSFIVVIWNYFSICWIDFFCAPLTEFIAVQLRLLFFWSRS